MDGQPFGLFIDHGAGRAAPHLDLQAQFGPRLARTSRAGDLAVDEDGPGQATWS